MIELMQGAEAGVEAGAKAGAVAGAEARMVTEKKNGRSLNPSA